MNPLRLVFTFVVLTVSTGVFAQEELHLPWGSSFLKFQSETQKFSTLFKSEGLLVPAFLTLQKHEVCFDQKSGEFLIYSRIGAVKKIPEKTAGSTVFFEKISTSRFPAVALSVSKDYAPNQGFEYTLRSFRETDSEVEAAPLSSNRLDVFLSDFARTEDAVYLAGSNQKNTELVIYRYSFAAKTWKEMFRSPRKDNFVKLVRLNSSIYFYASAQKKEASPWLLRNLDSPDVNLASAPYSGCFFGKGTSDGTSLYLPYFRSETGRIELLQVTENRVRAVGNLPIGLYQPLRFEGTTLVYLGFDYFQDPKKFELVRFSVDSGKTIEKVEMPQR